MGSDIVTRRRFPRIEAHDAVHLRKIGPEAMETCGKTRQIGLGGCTFVNCEPIGRGSAVDLLISVKPHRVIQAVGRVVYEKPIQRDRFEAGVEFLSISPSDRAVLASLFQPEPRSARDD